MKYRIGYGEDIHRLVEGRKLILAGIEIPFEKGLLGHSDADVILHSVGDAILGSLALGDIGKLFPDDIEETKDMDSSLIVKKAISLAKEKGYEVGNIDISVCLEKPKLAPYIEKMRKNLASLLETPLENVSIKAMTNEKLDSIGEGKAIKSIAVILMKEGE